MKDDICRFVRDHLAIALPAKGLDESQVITVLEDLERRIRLEYGGDDHYVPSIDKKRRNKALIADWKTGVQIEALAKKYDLHLGSVYRIVRNRQKTAITSAGLGHSEWNL